MRIGYHDARMTREGSRRFEQRAKAAATFLMSPPHVDWSIRGRANVFTQGDANVARGAALRDWLALADAIVDAGGEIATMRDVDTLLTGLPYTAEAGHPGRDTFLLPNVTPGHRVGEVDVIERTLRDEWRFLARRTTAKWEGQGDVIRVWQGFVCTSGDGKFARTAADAYDEIGPLLGEPSIHIRFRADPWFHGNTFLASYWNTLVVCPDALLPGEMERLRAFTKSMDVVEITRDESLRYATNALVVKRTIITPAPLPESVMRALPNGAQVRVVPLPALFERGGGGPVCLTNRLPQHMLPRDALSQWRNVRARLQEELASCR